MKDWYSLENIPVRWLVDGLLPADGFSAITGKPKVGKSTVIRTLVTCVIKSQPFLDRQVNVPLGAGRVLYIHLDRKDKPTRVALELRQLGITADEAPRLVLRFADNLPAPSNNIDMLAARLAWLKQEIVNASPDLIVIDLLQQFLCISDVNDYAKTVGALSSIQDALTSVDYNGAFLAALHSRKASNPDQPFDDTLGSTGLRGSFTTLISLRQYRTEGIYTIMSDQTEREAPWNEIEETILSRDSDGTLTLGKSMTDLQKAGKSDKQEEQIQRVLKFICDHPGCQTEEVMKGLAIAKPGFLGIVNTIRGMLTIEGEGKKGDPFRYSLGIYGPPSPA